MLLVDKPKKKREEKNRLRLLFFLIYTVNLNGRLFDESKVVQ